MAWKEYCAKYWLNKLQESMDRCTGRHDTTNQVFRTLSALVSLLTLCKQQILDSTKLKDFADNNLKIDENGRKFSNV